ncbi:hypothetical protein C440_07547 [Haloferax mucosum ATCC BAA-1512]|uniref:Uncharacterized protein n=2 Tax=Haloferax mucosum TaxID=403181 RepID=M0IFS1_9EURY|nr:hypothetical protein C440_07547 [Haloferax mucosum ATCC BAA-1512]
MQSDRSGSATVTVRVDENLKKDYTNALDGSMSDDLRAHMEEVARTVRDEPEDDNLPEDEALRDGYIALRRTAEAYDPSGRRLDVGTAISKVAERAGIPKEAVRRRILKPLEQRGYIAPKWGDIIVYRPEEVATAKTETKAKATSN